MMTAECKPKHTYIDAYNVCNTHNIQFYKTITNTMHHRHTATNAEIYRLKIYRFAVD